MRLDEFNHRVRALIEAKMRYNSPDSPSNVEPASRRRSMEEKENKGYDSPCRITISSVRKRLADIDGISGKAAIDGLVHSGLLRGDSPEFVREVCHKQEKGNNEQTVITIEEL